eukprot:CAMPEP_0179423758 /NCGR_PEP_ID=MMETSP0799-20121207/11194_1 /TAXON_ID=46947 /ORGANISM="Geminigera cryophila, Strain CCMP2564" /LENGTH=206 /DNA_ID=CAMNT_0021198101 /DNA_START=274 /DNA_END=894 /DNA_ORIENTATION=-
MHVAYHKSTMEFFLGEIRIHAVFTKNLMAQYVHHSYSDSAELMQAKSKLFFNHNQARFDNIPIGKFALTCVTGNNHHTEIENDLQNVAICCATPTLVRTSLHQLHECVVQCQWFLCQFVDDCTHPTAQPLNRLVIPVQHKKILQHKLQEIVEIVKTDFCGKYLDEMEHIADYILTLLGTNDLQMRHAIFLLCLLHILELKTSMFLQ